MGTALVAHLPRRAQLERCSERGEARHFDIDVSDVDVPGNLGQVHVLHGGDGSSWRRRQTALPKNKKSTETKPFKSRVIVAAIFF